MLASLGHFLFVGTVAVDAVLIAILLLALWWRALPIGTKSVLLGAHCFLVHPWFVAWGWYQVYGFRRVVIGTRRVLDWRETVNGRSYGRRYPKVEHRVEMASLWRPALWVAFFVHDVGYLGKPNIDGPDGEEHPHVGADITVALFGEPWGAFVLFHSRFLAKRYNSTPSALCMADKMALAVTPWWLYLPMVMFTGEAREYSFHKSEDFSATKWSGDPKNAEERRLASSDSVVDRVRSMQMYTRRYVAEHADGRADTWTPASKPEAVEL